ncbi:hypothetical protein BTI_4096 [Burkholderia thailandensis MSMB121]|uniref:hypothetical protein n=1 Tax=Burkholderia humptydooensis TaxID=430531 RepID=UPI000328053C|nr:hypothetical protein [Burkholderia humptydooensis]AGK50268.1 hypothetical protein BTI_4096 [Burkholderia thailandensis MSMB121]ATF32330.1 hypothetical protein CO709_02110 [Burkholderia thailandensis]KST72389.1 hypothetical protein WS76_28400 [Burkholderia humptydooensis]
MSMINTALQAGGAVLNSGVSADAGIAAMKQMAQDQMKMTIAQSEMEVQKAAVGLMQKGAEKIQ